jgi:peptidoglycan/xylan/chitin deacetylase (PgdA/CDA1 family)
MTPYVWPDGCAWGFALGIDVDAETPMLWRLRDGRASAGRRGEYRRFGLRQESTGCSPCSTTWTCGRPSSSAWVAEHHPTLVPSVAALGHEVGLHGYVHEDVGALDETANREVLHRSIGILGAQLGYGPVGYRSPSWTMTEYLPDLLREHGVVYDSSLMGYEHPYTYRGLTELPVSWTADDATYFFYQKRRRHRSAWPTHLVEQAWRDEVAAARRFSNLLCLTVHPWIVGRGHRLQALERVLADVEAGASVFRSRCVDIARYHEQSVNRERYVAC